MSEIELKAWGLGNGRNFNLLYLVLEAALAASLRLIQHFET